MSNTANITNMSVVRMPKEFFPFMKRNPKLTQIVGQALMEIHAAQKHIDDMKLVLQHSEDLRAELEDGTPEEMEGFIKGALEGSEFGVMDFDDLPPGLYDKLREELGDDAFFQDSMKNDEGDLG